MGSQWRRSKGAELEGEDKRGGGENKRGGAGWLSSLIHLSDPSRVN